MGFLTRFGIQKSRLTVLVMVGLLLLGALSYYQLPKREDPEISLRTAIAVAQYPGMSPERVEELIAEPLERAGREIDEVETIVTLITRGQAELKFEIYDSVPNAELERVYQDIRNKMNDSIGLLPEGTLGPFVNTDFDAVAIATIAVTGEGFSYEEIWDAAEDLQKQIYTLSGITKVGIEGRQEERIWLEIDTRKLASVGVQLDRLLSDLSAQNVIVPAGNLDANGVNIMLEANGDLKSVQEIREVLTKVPGLNGLVRLQDLLNVRRGYVDPQETPIFFNGEPALLLSVEMDSSRDIQTIGADLKQRLPEFEATQPIGIQYSISTFQESNVTQAINGALTNVGQTFLTVFVVMLAFLGLRPAFVVSCIVPFSVMFSLILMSRAGIPIEQVSIAAVIISLGLLVDNGLVVVEEIQSRLNAGEAPSTAAENAGSQFFIPLAVASITTASAFIPMLILEGAEGDYAFSLGAVVGFMLLGSWITAHYILPFLSTYLLRPSKKAQAGTETWMIRSYGNLTRILLKKGLLVAGVIYGIILAGTTVFGSLKGEMFPLAERAEFLVYLEMPRGTAVTATREEALAVDAWLRDAEHNPEVVSTTLFVASGGPRFFLTLDPADSDPANAFFVVNTTDFESAVAAAERARNYLVTQRPAASYRITRLAMGGEESGIVDVEISGPNADVLVGLARKVQDAFDTVPGVILNQNDWGNKTVKFTVEIAQDKAREFGVTSKDVSEVMEVYFSGVPYSVYRDGADSIPIVVRAQEPFRDSIEDLENLSIPGDGRLISLAQIADFTPTFEFSQLRRENQVRKITVSGKSAYLSAAAVEQWVAQDLAALTLPPGYRLSLGGETERSAEINALLLAGMPAALLVMLAALMFQFNSVRRVALTFLTVPMILIGAPLALFLASQPLSFFAILGLISLMGIIINNAIVLIDQIDIERETLPLDDAIVAAAKKRVTPVMLTSLTTTLGLVPMALNGGALFEPMATLMIGGLIVASPLTLLFVPSVYRLMFVWDERRREAATVTS